MWKKALQYINLKRKATPVEEAVVTEPVKQFKASAVETWTYGMTELPLREVEEVTTSHAVTPKKEERVMGESV